MNHQENFTTNVGLKFPNPFSAWPYFILILATLLMGSTKVSSQSMEQKNRLHHGIEMTH